MKLHSAQYYASDHSAHTALHHSALAPRAAARTRRHFNDMSELIPPRRCPPAALRPYISRPCHRHFPPTSFFPPPSPSLCVLVQAPALHLLLLRALLAGPMVPTESKPVSKASKLLSFAVLMTINLRYAHICISEVNTSVFLVVFDTYPCFAQFPVDICARKRPMGVVPSVMSQFVHRI